MMNIAAAQATGDYATSFKLTGTIYSVTVPITGVLTPACPTLHALWQTGSGDGAA
jgi:hypothetical protein